MAKAKTPKDDIPEDLAKDTTAMDATETPDAPDNKLADEETKFEDVSTDEHVDVRAPDASEVSDTDRPNDEARDPFLGPDPDPFETKADDDIVSDRHDAIDEPVQAEPEESEVMAPAPAPVPAQQSGSIWPAVFGGVIAAMLGFIAGRADQFDAYLPASMQRESVNLEPLMARTTALSGRMDTLETASANETDFASRADLDAAVSEIGNVNATLLDLGERIDALEARPVATGGGPTVQPVDNSEEIAALRSTVESLMATDRSDEIVALQASIEELQAQIGADEARAKSEAERILAQAALTRVMTAVNSGETFEPALGAFEEVTPVEVPDVLRAAAAEGVPSLPELRENFPDAARAGLAAARLQVPESDVAGIGGFLRRQLSARSVTPREGNAPDAVLSRAEGLLKAGNLDGALTELDALPDAAKTAMQSWLENANARQNARSAAQDLSDSLTVN